VIPSFDIFRVVQNGHAIWVEPSNSLEEAKARVQELAAAVPGEYLIFNQKTGHKISVPALSAD
jgi:hypothetical protein